MSLPRDPHRTQTSTVAKETPQMMVLAKLYRPAPSLLATFAVASLLLSLAAVAPAAAGAAAPAWRIDSLSNTTAAPGGIVNYDLQFSNVGDAEADGTGADPIVFKAQLPAGITAKEMTIYGGFPVEVIGWSCEAQGGGAFEGASAVECIIHDAIGPNSRTLGVGVLALPVLTANVAIGASSAPALFTLAGAGASPAATADPTIISATPPPFGTDAFDAEVSADAAGAPYTQAAGHPYSASTWIDFNTVHNPGAYVGDLFPVEPPRDVSVELPPGLVGNPSGLDHCSGPELANSEGTGAKPLCSSASQVGTVMVKINPSAPPVLSGEVLGPVPVFSMVSPPGVPARFGFNIEGVVVTLDARLRSDGDYGLSVDASGISEGLPIAGTEVTFWGVPSDPSHDRERACRGDLAPWQGGPSCASSVNAGAFLRNPTSCEGEATGLPVAVHVDSWAHPGSLESDGAPDLSDPAWRSQTIVSHNSPGYPLRPGEWGSPQGPTGCAQVPFTPDVSVQPTTHQADSPTGLNVDLTVPQEAITQVGAISQSDLEDAVVTLPKGLSVNPASADGLGSCSPAQIGMTTAVGQTPIHFDEADPTCPNSSKLGNLTIKSPLLEEALTGSVYLASQGQNPFGSLLAIYFVAQGSGVTVKLPGHIEPQADGQLVARFDEQPQVPFEKVHLELFGGARASLRTPASCGKYATTATLTPWSGNEDVQLNDSFQITEGPGGGACPNAAFAPKLSAGTTNPLAASFSPFVLKLTREDGSRELTGLTATLPPGMIGRLAGIPYCPDATLATIPTAEGTGAAQNASPSCPAASQVGTVTAGAGAGTNPFYVKTGRAYLAGPYKGAPLSLAIVTPALAGPFDLGNVVVRTALNINETTTQITAVSDPIPTILDGIPLDLRSLEVDINRPSFTLNPTSCNPMAINGVVGGTNGATANVSDRFQVGNCAALPFKPKLAFRLKGGTKRGDNPAFAATLTAKPGEANIAKAVVTLPHSEFLDQGHIKTICTRVQFAANQCPKGSVYGFARAITPLLDKPLEGPVYLRSSSNKLPDLVADLNGQIHVVLDGRIDSPHGGIRNSFEVVPDAPVSKFTLTMQGGTKGLLQNSTDICARPQKATVQLDGQNGKTHDFNPVLKADCSRQGPRTAR